MHKKQRRINSSIRLLRLLLGTINLFLGSRFSLCELVFYHAMFWPLSSDSSCTFLVDGRHIRSTFCNPGVKVLYKPAVLGFGSLILNYTFPAIEARRLVFVDKATRSLPLSTQHAKGSMLLVKIGHKNTNKIYEALLSLAPEQRYTSHGTRSVASQHPFQSPQT